MAQQPDKTKLVGVISDTHGLLRDAALQALAGVHQIIHAGDVGDPAILETLSEIAPVTAVRGNIDKGDWSLALPMTAVAECGEQILYVLHDINELDLDPRTAGFGAVISGHSHQPSSEVRDDVLFLNPGSAGPRRFNLPITLVRLTVSTAQMVPEFVYLE